MEIIFSSILIWIIALIIIGLDLTILVAGKGLASRLFLFATSITALWVILQGFLLSSTIILFSSYLVRIQYLLGIIMAIGFYHFSIAYPTDKKPSRKSVVVSVLIITIFAYLYFCTNLIIADVYISKELNKWIWVFGKWHLLFEIVFSILWMGTLWRLFNTHRKTSGQQKIKVGIVFLTLFVGIIPPALADIFLPAFGVYQFDLIGPLSSLFWVSIIAYAITKHNLFNIKLIAVQLVTFALWIFILIRTIFAETTRDLIIQGSLLFITVVFGVILIRSVLHEITQRERIEKLANELTGAYRQIKDVNEHLEDKVAEQTKEIQAAYDVEKKARRELEELNKTKDQFITSTQHHLRTPMTSLKWELEAIRNGSCGPVGPELKQALDNSDTAAKNLSDIIENFIKITERKV